MSEPTSWAEAMANAGRSNKIVIIETTPKDMINIIKMAKLELLDDFKKANPHYYAKLEECIDFQKIIKQLHKTCKCKVGDIVITDRDNRIATCKKCGKHHSLSEKKFKLLSDVFNMLKGLGKVFEK